MRSGPPWPLFLFLFSSAWSALGHTAEVSITASGQQHEGDSVVSEGSTPQTILGHHLIVELEGVSFEALNDAALIRDALSAAADVGNFTKLGVPTMHAFTPHGVTGFLLLAESHFSIHTWPENGYAAVDMFTCGQTSFPDAALESMRVALGEGALPAFVPPCVVAHHNRATP